MKICMLAPEFLPVWGGVGTYIVELARHLPKNVEIHVITPKRKGFGREKVSSLDFDFSKYFGNNVKVHFVCNANDTFLYNAKFQYACLKYIPKLLKEEEIDILHSHTAHMPDLLLQFRKLKIPIVTTIHTTIRGQRNGTRNSRMDFADLAFSEKMTYLMYPFLASLETLYFLRKRSYITVSFWMKDQILKQYPQLEPSSISVIHNSVDTNRFSPNQTSYKENEIVLFTGRLIAAKGINCLLEATVDVLKDYPKAVFVFIGAGNSLPYQKRFRELGISESNFKFVGYLKEASDLVKYYRASSIYVAPTFYENLPIRVLEAMACGVPVVASNVCAIPEAIDNGFNGIMVKPGSTEELSAAICCLLGDSKMRRKLGRNARNTVLERFDWSLNVTKVVETYEKVLNDFDDDYKLEVK